MGLTHRSNHLEATTSQSDALGHRHFSMSALSSLVVAIYMKKKPIKACKLQPHLTLPAHDAQFRPRGLLAILDISRHGCQHRRAHHRRQRRRTPCCRAREPVTSLSPHRQPRSHSSEATMEVIPTPHRPPLHRPPPQHPPLHRAPLHRAPPHRPPLHHPPLHRPPPHRPHPGCYRQLHC